MRIEYSKWDGRLHWHFDLDMLGEDEHGLWLGGRRGCALQRGHEAPIFEQHGFVFLVPATGQWLASFSSASGATDVDVYVDVTDTPQRLADGVRAIDLDLDIVRWRDGRVIVDDEDEFLEHQRVFGYPPDVIAAAEATAAQLFDDVRARTEPFGDAPSAWLARLSEL